MMLPTTSTVVFLWMFLNSLSSHCCSGADGTTIVFKDLVKQFGNSQIILHIPRLTSDAVPHHVTSRRMEEALECTHLNLKPVQLAVPTNNNISARTHFSTGRHIENCIVWFIFLSAESKIRLQDVLRSRTLLPTSLQYRQPVSIKHHINLIVVHTQPRPTPNDFPLDFYVSPFLTPLFLVITHVYSSGDIPPSRVHIFDVCYIIKACRLIPLPNYMDLFKRMGIKEILKLADNLRKDFRGDRLVIGSSSAFQYKWEDWKNILSLPWRNQMQTSRQRAFVGEFLLAFAAIHNFTFDTALHKTLKTVKRTHGSFTMKIQINIPRPGFIGPLSLNMFDYMCTFTCPELEEQIGRDFQLETLTMPVNSQVVWVLLIAATVWISLIFMQISNKMDLCGAMLLSFSALVSQVSSDSSRLMRNLRSIYVPWLLLTTLLSIIHTNMLQSRIVVPEMRIEELPIEELVRENFTIFSHHVPFLHRVDAILKRQLSQLDADSVFYRKVKESSHKISLIAKNAQQVSAVSFPFLFQMNPKERKVFFEIMSTIQLYSKMCQAVHRNAGTGKERFLDLPTFYYFRAQKSFLLVRSLELLKATGLVGYLEKQKMETIDNIGMKYAYLYAKQNGSDGGRAGFNFNRHRAGFSYSIIRESFVLLAYGLGSSLVLIVVEIFIAHFHHLTQTAVLIAGLFSRSNISQNALRTYRRRYGV